MSSLAFLDATVPKAKVKPKVPTCIVVIAGPPGCGKTTVAFKLMETLDGDWICVNSDRDGKSQGYYTRAEKHLEALEHGSSGGGGGVIIDMCMTAEMQRYKAVELSRNTGIPLVFFHPNDPIVDIFGRGVAGVQKRGHNHESLGPKTPEERVRIVGIFASQLMARDWESSSTTSTQGGGGGGGRGGGARFLDFRLCTEHAVAFTDSGIYPQIVAMLKRINGNFLYRMTTEDDAVVREMIRNIDVRGALTHARPANAVVTDIIAMLLEA
jgi:hypothetical protein